MWFAPMVRGRLERSIVSVEVRDGFASQLDVGNFNRHSLGVLATIYVQSL